MKLSLVVPCYNEQDSVAPFYNAATAVFFDNNFELEIVFVNDGSKDDTLSRLRALHESDRERTAVVSFSRNFGKEAAILAGMKRASGDLVCFIDADLQQHPSVAREMADFLSENSDYDCVCAYQAERKESKILSGFKSVFYKLINNMSDTEFVNGASDFRMLRRCAVDAVAALPEYQRFSKGLFSWVGFNTYYMPYQVLERVAGTTKWSFRKLFKYAVDGFTSFSTFPLKIANYLGLFASFGSVIYLIAVLIEKLFFGIAVPGYPTIISLILLIGGVQLLILGIIGEYIGRIFMQGKGRPIYIEKEYLRAENSVKEEAEND